MHYNGAIWEQAADSQTFLWEAEFGSTTSKLHLSCAFSVLRLLCSIFFLCNLLDNSRAIFENLVHAAIGLLLEQRAELL